MKRCDRAQRLLKIIPHLIAPLFLLISSCLFAPLRLVPRLSVAPALDVHWPTSSGPSRGPCSYASPHCTWLTLSLWEKGVEGVHAGEGGSQWVENRTAQSSTRRANVIHDQWCFSNYIPIKGKPRAWIWSSSQELLTGFATSITIPIYVGTSSIPLTHHPLTHTHTHLVRIPILEACVCSLVCQQNRCEFITGRLRAVQRANAYYYIDAGLTPPYTQQSIKSPGRWRKSIGPEPPGIDRGQREREWEEARKQNLKSGVREDLSMANMKFCLANYSRAY